LYFPDLVDIANNYILAQHSYYKVIVTSFSPENEAAALSLSCLTSRTCGGSLCETIGALCESLNFL